MAAPRTDASDRRKEVERPPLFPYHPRPSQIEIVNAVQSAMDLGKHLIMESGTGTGKTVCSLVGALQHAKANKKKVLYLTRTISQSDQVMKELRSVSRRQRVSGLAMQGRRRSCLLLRTLEELEDIPPHALSKICEERKARTWQGILPLRPPAIGEWAPNIALTSCRPRQVRPLLRSRVPAHTRRESVVRSWM